MDTGYISETNYREKGKLRYQAFKQVKTDFIL